MRSPATAIPASSISTRRRRVTVDLASGTGHGTAAGDLANVGNDTFAGGVNGAFGGAFDDTLRGSDNTEPGSIEQFDGRGGDDTIDGRGGFDQVTYGNDLSVTAGITVHMVVNDGPIVSTVDGDDSVGHDTLVSIESVIGTRFGDIYNALNFVGFNEFQGLGGNDQITGNGCDPARLLQRHFGRDRQHEAGNRRWRRLGWP